jgi:hypothetical protein
MSGTIWIIAAFFVSAAIIILLIRRWIMSKERSMDELHSTCDKACEILKKTNDGDLLDPQDLKITEYAVNGYLNESGREVFDKLYQRVVVDGAYVKPYLHDIEHITRDHEGYIYYKGIHVEHYDHDYVYSEDAKYSLMELKRRCDFLERKGVDVSNGSVIWGWDNHSGEYGAERQKELDALLGRESEGLRYSIVEIYNSGREYKYFICGKPEGPDEIKDHPVTQSMKGRYFDDEYEITVKSFIYGKRLSHKLIPIDEIANKTEVERLLASCHDYLMAHDRLNALPEIKHKTDFAEGYERTKLLDSLIDHPGRSLRYSEVFMYGYGSDQTKLYFCGVPTFDEVKAYHEYESMLESYGDRLTVSMTTYQYGNGRPLTPEEMKPLFTAPFIETLGEAHYYLQKHDLSREISWKDLTRDIEVNRGNAYQAEQERDEEEGYEP